MEEKSQQMFKSKICGSVQEVIFPDFPDDDNTVTTTVTKSRRVSFGTNFIKEFIVGSAVSATCVSEYEQAFSSSDSSNPNSSHSAIESDTLDHDPPFLPENSKIHPSGPPVFKPPGSEFVEQPKPTKFSRTICFSADSPTADMEFTEGCITLAKNIFDKKNKEMTVIIQAKSKEPKEEERPKKEDVTIFFDGSQIEMSETRCLKSKENKREERKFESDKTRIFNKFDDEMSITRCDKMFRMKQSKLPDDNDFMMEESKENRMPLDLIMRQLDKDDSDSDLFNPEKSFSDVLNSQSFDLTNESEKLNLNESMDISRDFQQIVNETFQKRVSLNEKTQEHVSFNKIQEHASFNEQAQEHVSLNEKSQENVSLNERTREHILFNEQAQEHVSLIEKTRELILCCEESQEHVSFNEQAQEHVSLNEKTRENVSLSEKTQERIIFNEKTEEHVSLNERTRERILFNEKTEKNVLFNEQAQEHVSLNEKTRENVSLSEKTQERIIFNEKTEEHVSLNERTRERILFNEKTEKNVSFNEQAQKHVSLNEKTRENVSLSEKTRERIIFNEKTEEHVSLNERTRERILFNEKTEKNVSFNEQAQEHVSLNEKTGKNVSFNKIQEHVPLNEKTREHASFNEQAKEHVSLNERTRERILFNEKTEEHASFNEQALERVSLIEKTRELILCSEKTEEHDSFNEQAQEHVSLNEKTEENVTLNKIQEHASFNEQAQEHVPLNEKTREHVSFNEQAQEQVSLIEKTEENVLVGLSVSDEFDAQIFNCQTEEEEVQATPADNVDFGHDVSMEIENEENPEKMSANNLSRLEQTFAEESFKENIQNQSEPLLVDVKVIENVEEQSKESNCVWTLEDVRYPESKTLGLLSFNFTLLQSPTIVQFSLKKSREGSIDSGSVITESSVCLKEETAPRRPEYNLVLRFGFKKQEEYFNERKQKISNIRHIPIFLDEINNFMKKINSYLEQVYEILISYPGSTLTGAVLSFRLFSYPIFFSSTVFVDLTHLFRLSESSLSFKREIGHMDEKKIRSIFQDCLKEKNCLREFIIRSSKHLFDVERSKGLVSKRSHIRLLPAELRL